MNISSDTIVVATNSQVSCELNHETVILHFDKGAYFGLNDVGTVVWEKLQRPQAVSAIRDAILAEYDVDRSQCESDVLRLLNRLHDEGLIEVRNGPSS
jgi:Coenzyme PQQ synthesis protein D (PqqD)